MDQEAEISGWAGWAIFAAIMMMMVGTFQAIAGLTALVNDQYFLVTSSGLTLELDYTTWGWIHLGLGVLIVLAGVAVLKGSMLGRIVGIALAALSALANLVWMAAYPIWSIIIISVDVLTIFALAVHGGELKRPDELTMQDVAGRPREAPRVTAG